MPGWSGLGWPGGDRETGAFGIAATPLFSGCNRTEIPTEEVTAVTATSVHVPEEVLTKNDLQMVRFRSCVRFAPPFITSKIASKWSYFVHFYDFLTPEQKSVENGQI